MRRVFLAVALSAPFVAPVLAQTAAPSAPSGPADLCHDLLTFAEKKADEPPKPAQGQAGAASAAPAARSDNQSSGTQGGGSVSGDTSKDTSSQSSAPTTSPVSTGAAPEAASSAHASDGRSAGQGANAAGANVPRDEFNLAGGIPLKQVRQTAEQGDRQACRNLAQKVRRAGGDLPAELIALAAYEPDPAKRK
jgi:hypothetical protein